MTDHEQSRDLIKGKAFHRFGIATVAILMILFGLAEIVTGFTHNFFGVSTTRGAFSAYANAGVGALDPPKLAVEAPFGFGHAGFEAHRSLHRQWPRG